MSLGLVSEHSLWLSPICILLAFVYAYLFYHKDYKFEESSTWIVRSMFALRFISVFLLCFLMLAPMLRYFSTQIEKPILIFAQDNSKSLLINKDSIYYKKQYKTDLETLKKKLSDKYELASFTFGGKVSKDGTLNFKEKQTDISEVFDEIGIRYANRNVGAVVLLSDGIYNKGNNPLTTAASMNFPIYTVALGDTIPQRDIAISQIRSNRTAFLNTKFPVQITVSANQLNGKKTKLTLTDGDKTIYEQEIGIGTNSFFRNFEVLVDADKAGIKHLKAKLTAVDGEISIANNSKDIMVDIVDSKQKILIVGNSPHPDLNALLTALETNQSVEVSLLAPDKIKKSFKEYNLVILHQLPSVSNPFSAPLAEIFKADVPVLFILGGQSSVANINQLKTSTNIKQQTSKFEEAQASINKNFSLFELSEEIKEAIESNPPLLAPFGEYQQSAGNEILFYQKIKGIATNKPLMSFSSSGDQKIGFIFGEGLWRWKTYLFVHTGKHQAFEDLIGKITQYMALKAVKENFVVNVKKIYGEEEQIEFTAEVYNQSYELVDNAKVSLEITMPDKKKMNYELPSQKGISKKYVLNVGSFPVGKYAWSAKAELGGKTYSKSGLFNVMPLQIEADNSVANHQLLNQLATSHDGKMVSPQQMDKLYSDIINSHEIVPVVYTEKKLQDLISLKAIFFLLLILLSAEWFIRKYNGGY